MQFEMNYLNTLPVVGINVKLDLSEIIHFP